MTNEEFLNKIKPDVIADMHESNILASLTAAQALLESNHGESKLAEYPNNNLFGIKGSYNGSYVTMKTKEYVNGKYIVVDAAFKKYPDWLSSIKDHSAMFNRLSRYSNLRGERDYKTACRNVQKDGYATSPVYADSLIRVIESYKLYEWDHMEPIPEDTDLKRAIDIIAERVIDGKFGYGHELRASSIYALVRARVNELLT